MLLRYGTRNFFCFKDWITIDLTLNEKVPPEIRDNGYITRTLCLKGANSSGKTNALKALSFLAFFCKDSFLLKPEQSISFDTFFNNNENTEFFIDFSLDNIEYSYELVLSQTKIFSEKLYRKEKRKTLVLSRSLNKITKNTFFETKKQFTLRSNASIISTAKQYEINAFTKVYDFFDGFITNVGYKGLQHDFLDNSTLSKFYSANPELLKFVKNQIKKFDTGITDIKIESFINDKNDKVFFPVFSHTVDNLIKPLQYNVQSSGTKSLYQYLVFYYMTLQRGSILALDEFDINLHPDILPHLVELFENSKDNPKRSQLLFTTHNTEVIDIMGKYRTYLFNKENGASYCYRLDELGNNVIRNDRPISPLYRAGKLGGVPRI